MASIDLAEIEPFQAVERVVPLSHSKHGQKGEIRLQMVFQPEIIAKTRRSTTAVGTAGRAMTQVAALPLGAGKGVVHGVGSTGKAVMSVFKRDHIAKASVDSVEVAPTIAVSPASASDGSAASGPAIVTSGVATSAFPTAMPDGAYNAYPYPEAGTLRVTMQSASDLGPDEDVRPYAVVKIGDKDKKTKHGKGLDVHWYVRSMMEALFNDA